MGIILKPKAAGSSQCICLNTEPDIANCSHTHCNILSLDNCP